MLAIHRGSLDMHGAPHRFTWTRLNSTAEAGDDTIELIEEPVDWNVGDYITIASEGKAIDFGNAKQANTIQNGSLKFTLKHPGGQQSFAKS